MKPPGRLVGVRGHSQITANRPAVGVTAPMGLSEEETGALVRQAMSRMAEDYAFTSAETAQI